jgi:hypothetical protein
VSHLLRHARESGHPELPLLEQEGVITVPGALDPRFRGGREKEKVGPMQ